MLPEYNVSFRIESSKLFENIFLDIAWNSSDTTVMLINGMVCMVSEKMTVDRQIADSTSMIIFFLNLGIYFDVDSGEKVLPGSINDFNLLT